jgi:hypothetical protein
MLTSEFPIPEGYSPPFAIVTDTDHTAWLLIAATLSLCMILLFGIIRAFIRWTVSTGLGLDDAFLLAATVSNRTCFYLDQYLMDGYRYLP